MSMPVAAYLLLAAVFYILLEPSCLTSSAGPNAAFAFVDPPKLAVVIANIRN